MKMGKIVKKVVALSTGATMLGATILGAVAADLNQYPNPLFIKDGNFNGLMVIGADGDTQDMLGAMDIISSLQAATIIGNLGSTGTDASTSMVGEVYKIEKSSNVLNLGEGLVEIKSKLDEEQLPTVLSEGTVKTRTGRRYDYKQEIVFGDSLELQHFSDKHYEDEEATIGIPIDSNEVVLTYTLDFVKVLPVGDKDDIRNLLDKEIQILGETYDIVDASDTSLELMKGARSETMEEGDEATYDLNGKDYDVKVVIISDKKESVKFIVNSETTDSMEVGDTYTLKDGTVLGVREVLPNEAGDVTKDTVSFYLGAEKLTLEDGSELEINNEDVDGMDIIFNPGEGSDVIDRIEIVWTADDDLFITEDNDVTMPGLDAVKFSMGLFHNGIEESTEIYTDGDNTVSIGASLRDYDINLDVLRGNGNFDLVGENDKNKLITDTCGDSGFTITKATDQYFVVSFQNDNDAESNVLEVTRFDDNDGITVRDYDGNTIATRERYEFDVGEMNIEILEYSNDQVNLNVTDSNCVPLTLFTKEGLEISLPNSSIFNLGNSYTFVITQENTNEDVGKGDGFTVFADFENGDLEVNFKKGNVSLSGDKKIDDGNYWVGYLESDVSSRIIEDDDDERVEIIYPGEETYADVYVGSQASVVTTTASVDSSEPAILSKIEVGAAVLDTSLSSYTNQNLIVIGGPAINRAAASLMGKSYPAYGVDSGITENSGIIKLVEQTDGNVAVIVAGWEADDTQRAARVLSTFEDYDLKGTEVVISGTSLSDISVGVPVVEETEDNTTEE